LASPQIRRPYSFRQAACQQPPFRARWCCFPSDSPFCHYLSLIGSNFLHDNAHIKNILGWHLRSAHSVRAKKFLTCFQTEEGSSRSPLIAAPAL
jgi:hypothetical protein